jgi:hypothetical protein
VTQEGHPVLVVTTMMMMSSDRTLIEEEAVAAEAGHPKALVGTHPVMEVVTGSVAEVLVEASVEASAEVDSLAVAAVVLLQHLTHASHDGVNGEND